MRPRDNPFRVDRLNALSYRLDDDGWAHVMARLEAFGGRGAIVGPEGAGKTTLIEGLAGRLRGAGVAVRAITLHKGQRRLPRGCLTGLGAGWVLLIDGADELSRASWWAVRIRLPGASGLVITAHRTGMLPTLHACSTSPELLSDLVAELVGAEAAGALRPTLESLYRQYRGDLRAVLRALYDLWPTLKLAPLAAPPPAVRYSPAG